MQPAVSVAPDRRTSTRHVRGERGVTLVEILIATLVMGMVGIGVIGLLRSVVNASRVNRATAQDQSWLASASAFISDVSVEPPACDGGAAAAQASYQTVVDAGFTRSDVDGQVQVTSVAFWNGTAFVSTCTPGMRLQQIVLTVDSETGTTRQLTITKRPPAGKVAP